MRFCKPSSHFTLHSALKVISLYAALWLTVIVSLNKSEWKFLSVAPAILILMFFFYIVKTAGTSMYLFWCAALHVLHHAIFARIYFHCVHSEMPFPYF